MTVEVPPLMQEEDKAVDPRTSLLAVALVLNNVFFIARLIVNYTVPRLGGSDIGLLQPSFYAFQIWFVIFFFQALFVFWPIVLWYNGFGRRMTQRLASQYLAV